MNRSKIINSITLSEQSQAERPSSPPIALTIAGSDPSAGAGIQADLKTFSALGVYGTSVLTALTAQNTCGVVETYPIPAPFIEAQLEALLKDMPPRALKTGMLHNTGVIDALTRLLKEMPIPLVVDPVMVSTSGHVLIDPEAVELLKTTLFPCSRIMTPNLQEAAFLLGTSLAQNETEMMAQAEALLAFGPESVLLKGGHAAATYGGGKAIDICLTQDTCQLYTADYIETGNTHGTGCTLSAAITAGLAHDLSLHEAIYRAKKYVTLCISRARYWNIGQGAGPLAHSFFPCSDED